MALTIARRKLSGSTDGLPMVLNSTASASAIIHTGHTSTAIIDELHLWAKIDATKTASVTITVNINSACHIIEIPERGFDYPLLTGFPIFGRSAAGTQIEIWASTTGVVSVYGYINRITEV